MQGGRQRQIDQQRHREGGEEEKRQLREEGALHPPFRSAQPPQNAVAGLVFGDERKRLEGEDGDGKKDEHARHEQVAQYEQADLADAVKALILAHIIADTDFGELLKHGARIVPFLLQRHGKPRRVEIFIFRVERSKLLVGQDRPILVEYPCPYHKRRTDQLADDAALPARGGGIDKLALVRSTRTEEPAAVQVGQFIAEHGAQVRKVALGDIAGSPLSSLFVRHIGSVIDVIHAVIFCLCILFDHLQALFKRRRVFAVAGDIVAVHQIHLRFDIRSHGHKHVRPDDGDGEQDGEHADHHRACPKPRGDVAQGDSAEALGTAAIPPQQQPRPAVDGAEGHHEHGDEHHGDGDDHLADAVVKIGTVDPGEKGASRPEEGGDGCGQQSHPQPGQAHLLFHLSLPREQRGDLGKAQIAEGKGGSEQEHARDHDERQARTLPCAAAGGVRPFDKTCENLYQPVIQPEPEQRARRQRYEEGERRFPREQGKDIPARKTEREVQPELLFAAAKEKGGGIGEHKGHDGGEHDAEHHQKGADEVCHHPLQGGDDVAEDHVIDGKDGGDRQHDGDKTDQVAAHLPPHVAHRELKEHRLHPLTRRPLPGSLPQRRRAPFRRGKVRYRSARPAKRGRGLHTIRRRRRA